MRALAEAGSAKMSINCIVVQSTVEDLALGRELGEEVEAVVTV